MAELLPLNLIPFAFKLELRSFSWNYRKHVLWTLQLLLNWKWRESASFSLPLKILISSFWHELIKHCCKRSEFNQCRNRVSCLLVTLYLQFLVFPALTLETCWQSELLMVFLWQFCSFWKMGWCLEEPSWLGATT